MVFLKGLVPALFVMGVGTVGLAAGTELPPQAEAILGSCTSEWDYAVEEMKQELVESSAWNYDNDYDLSDVKMSEPFDLGSARFFVNVFFDVEGLNELGYVFEVSPRFEQDGSCAYIDTYWEQM